MKRIFFAYDVDEKLRERLAEESRRFRRELQDQARRLRWVEPERYHMTAVFLGDIEEERLAALSELLGAPRLSRKVAVTLGPPLVFPKPRYPRVLVRSVSDGAEPLEAAATLLRNALASAGFDFDGKPFRPHLTVAYLRKGSRSELAEIARRWLASPPGSAEERREGCGGGGSDAYSAPATGHVTALTLYESVRRSHGPEYRAVTRRELE